MQGDRLPDLAKLRRHLAEQRIGATLRGVEASVEGRLERVDGVLRLRFGREAVRLAPIRQGVHWSWARKRARKLSDAERSACSRLQSQWRGRPIPVRVAGTLVEDGKDGAYALEVRTFTWMR